MLSFFLLKNQSQCKQACIIGLFSQKMLCKCGCMEYWSLLLTVSRFLLSAIGLRRLTDGSAGWLQTSDHLWHGWGCRPGLVAALVLSSHTIFPCCSSCPFAHPASTAILCSHTCLSKQHWPDALKWDCAECQKWDLFADSSKGEGGVLIRNVNYGMAWLHNEAKGELYKVFISQILFPGQCQMLLMRNLPLQNHRVLLYVQFVQTVWSNIRDVLLQIQQEFIPGWIFLPKPVLRLKEFTAPLFCGVLFSFDLFAHITWWRWQAYFLYPSSMLKVKDSENPISDQRQSIRHFNYTLEELLP